MSDRMEDKLRSIGVNADQRKKIMAAAKLGLGPLAALQGQADKAAAPSLPTPAPPPPIRAALPQAMAAAASQAEERERRRKEAEKREAADEELDDLQGFLAGGKASARLPQRERPAERQRRVFNERPLTQPEVMVSSATAERAGSITQMALATEQFDAMVTASVVCAAPGLSSSNADRGRLPVAEAKATPSRHRSQECSGRQSSNDLPSQPEGLLSEEIVMAMLRRARPQGAVRSKLSTAVAEEELEHDRHDANEEDGRIAFLRAQRKSAKTKDKKRRKEAKARRAQANERAEEEMDDWDSSEERRKKRRLEKPERSSVVQIVQDPAKRNFWGQSVRGVVSGDYKGFSDAALERRFMAQQSSAGAGEKLMSEAEVMALLKQDRSQTRARRK